MRETFAIKVLTTDRSNLWTWRIFGMRMCYSITSAVPRPGLRRCTQNLPAFALQKPSSRNRVAECDFHACVLLQLNGRLPSCDPGLLLRIGLGTALARPPGLRAAEPGLGPKMLREPTAAGGRNLGLRRFRRRRLRQRGSRAGREPIWGDHGRILVSTAAERNVPKAGDPGSFIGGPGPLPR